MTIGLKNLVFFPLLTDTETETTYGPKIELAGAIDAQISPENAESNVMHADDVEWDSITPDSEYSISLETAGFPLDVLSKLQGHTLSNKGGVIMKDGDEPPYGALAFKAEKSKKAGGGYRYVELFKVKPAFSQSAYHTKEGRNITRQTGKMTMRGISRISDGLKQYITDDQTEGETFFTAPVTPTEPVTP